MRRLALLGLCVLAGACSSVRYYAHLAHGEWQLLSRREPVARVLADPATEARTRARLAQALQARAFASDRLALPRNRSYTRYAALGRPYAIWNVFATPPWSVDARTHCFPFAGCVAYRGYFDPKRAEAEAARFAASGDDVYVGGVTAYSTLGWFADPILDTMLRWSDDELDGTIFHELAHQRVYAKGDTAFNESYASFVQREGLRAWHAARGLPPPDERAAALDVAFAARVLALRARLATLYAGEHDAAALAAGKAAAIDAFRADYRAWRERTPDSDARYDAWVDAPINNAKLLPFGLYETWVPAFAALFREVDGDWSSFHAAVDALARAPAAQRQRRLDTLMAE